MKTAWVQILLCLVLGFGLGATFDNWGDRCCKKHHMKQHIKGLLSGHCNNCPCKGKKARVKHLSRKLNLTPEQKSQVVAIIKAKHKKIMALKNEFKPRFKAIRNSTREEIQNLLTPEQKKKFNSMHKEKQAHFKKQFAMVGES